MCGICGFSGEMTGYIGEQTLKEMLNIIKYRGPDDEGIYFNNKVALGMRRLSIIDLKKGHQPIYNENKRVWTIFNGEIYNYNKLKKSLLMKGHKFYTDSDTEVIVHLYEEYKEGFVTYLIGKFTIALWDNDNHKLILARDRMGIKPLYYGIKNNTLIFSSEIKSILKCTLIEPVLNQKVLGTYLQYRYIPDDQTMFSDIYKLMPGHMLVYYNNDIKIRQYWNLDINNFTNRPEFYYTENIISAFKNSIKDRLTSDVPIGIFLSGGLDSSIVLSEAAKLYKGKLKTFSIAFKNPGNNNNTEQFNELSYAKQVADFFGTKHFEYTIDPLDVISDINKIIWHLDEPLADPTAIPLYYICKFAKSHVKVVLSGEGADELFAGYKIYNEPSAINKYNTIPQVIRNNLIEPLISIMPFNYGKDFLKRAKLPISSRYKGIGRTFREEDMLSLVNREFYDQMESTSIDSYVNSLFKISACSDDISQMLYFDQKVWLPEDVLMKSDKISMANSIELRVPFLDHRLVEFASIIPANLKFRGGCEKYILKQSFKNSIPDFVLKRKKNGFPVPISSLLNNEYKQFAKDILLSLDSINRGYFNKSYIENLFKTNNLKKGYVCRQIWLLLTFELWQKIFVDNYSLSPIEQNS